ncbi:hypothetical protein HMPREF1143_1481 [Peptoanaerobacter stomatis]|uniref:Uncharacterized protein n=1 Tax=Peptoanaerobacter stomatis TaxID=796937 RepID=J5WVT5_9FIRM|nr:hypothetical protein [Peptoanaerobacter stomatis]EJU24757.1 hypothetical protein HMPREF1143_1481 [Peptoanaerobacter stomatis]NWO26023.1 zinc ribbon domain-containing protein [Peptostreptococcaceae bacterium oral taxon 081]
MYIDEEKIDKLLKSLKIKFFIWAFFVVISVYGIISGFTENSELADNMVTYIQFTVLFSVLAYLNFRKSNLIKSAYLYNNIFVHDAYGYIRLSELASKLNKTNYSVTKEIEKLLKLKILINISLELGSSQKIMLNKPNSSDNLNESIECPYCGAKITKRSGFTVKCEYCDSEIK